MRNLRFLLVVLGTALIGRGSIIFNDLSNNGTIPATISSPSGLQVQGTNFGGPNKVSAIVGAQFTPNQNYQLTEIDIAIGNGGPGDSNVTLEFFTDVGGLPGVQFGVLSGSFAAPASLTTVTHVPVSGVTVQGGTPYWLVALPGDANTTALWSLNGLNPSFKGPHAIDNPPVQGWTLLNGPSNFFDQAFAIQGLAIAPEPGTWVLMCAGLGLLGMPRARRLRRSR